MLPLSVRMPLHGRPLSKLNSFDQNFMNLGHTIMSFSSLPMFHIAPCIQELLPFVLVNSLFLIVVIT